MAVSLQQSPSLVPRPVLKLIVEHPVLAPYLHPEAPGRVPLLVSDHLLEPGVTPSRFGQPLRIVPDRELGTEPPPDPELRGGRLSGEGRGRVPRRKACESNSICGAIHTGG